MAIKITDVKLIDGSKARAEHMNRFAQEVRNLLYRHSMSGKIVIT